MDPREVFINAAKPRTKDIEVPEWGGLKVTIRELSADTLLRLGKEARDSKGEDEIESSAKEIVKSVINGDGQLMFAESDIPLLLSFGSGGILRLRRAINELN